MESELGYSLQQKDVDESYLTYCCCSVAQLCLTLWPHEMQHARPPCPSPTPGVHSNSRPSSQWCHPFSFCLLSLPTPGSFPMSWLVASGGQSIGAWTSVTIQGTFPLGLSGLVSLQSKGLSRVFSNTTLQKHQFFGIQPSSQSNSHIHTWPQEKP